MLNHIKEKLSDGTKTISKKKKQENNLDSQQFI